MPAKRAFWPARVRRRRVRIETDSHCCFHKTSWKGENSWFSSQGINTKFTSLMNLLKIIKSCKNNKKTLFSSECTQRRQSRASTTGDPNGFMLGGSQPSDPAWRHHQTSPSLYKRHGMVKHKITAFTIAGGQPWPCTGAACRSSSSLHFIQGSFA